MKMKMNRMQEGSYEILTLFIEMIIKNSRLEILINILHIGMIQKDLNCVRELENT
jgi:hypothetical protein